VSLQLDKNVGNKVWDVVGVCADESAETEDPNKVSYYKPNLGKRTQFTSIASLLIKIPHQTHFGIGWGSLTCPSSLTRMSGTKSWTL
jgi:hypothetical protein